jgi:hypothetical protein
MAKLDWLFLPVEMDEDIGEDRAPRLPVRMLNRLAPQPGPAELRLKSLKDSGSGKSGIRRKRSRRLQRA